MNQRLQKYMDLKVPRYTSYPTAPHFSKTFQSATYADWLQNLPVDDPISLYLHVPFCRQLCWYCGCNMKLANRESTLSDYTQTLLKEIDLVSGYLPSRLKVSHLHWGGGTPTALVPDDLSRAMEAVHDRFTLVDGAELAIESDPRTLTDEMIARIGQLGFTRASFGVQEFDPQVQKAISRVQPPDMVQRSVDGLRGQGVSAINFDLIYGLPHQTTETLLKTIDLCVDMRPDRIALFGYAHVPWMAKKQRLIDEAALPDTQARLAQSHAAAIALQDAGYVAIGLDHFALATDPMAIAATDGTLRRNFQGYTTDATDTMLGFGSTTIGRTPQGYFQNLSETGAWARAVNEGRLPIGKGLSFQGDDALRGVVIEELMCRGAVNLDAPQRYMQVPEGWYLDHIPQLDCLEKDGLLTRDGGLIRATPDGLTLIRVIAAVFDSYLVDQAQQHAVAV